MLCDYVLTIFVPLAAALAMDVCPSSTTKVVGVVAVPTAPLNSSTRPALTVKLLQVRNSGPLPPGCVNTNIKVSFCPVSSNKTCFLLLF